MNQEQAKKLAPVIQAFGEGGRVEFRNLSSSQAWYETQDPCFAAELDGDVIDWRVKPDLLELWVNVYETNVDRKGSCVYEAFEDEEKARKRGFDCLSSYKGTFKMIEAD